jgi:hypothetical protein
MSKAENKKSASEEVESPINPKYLANSSFVTFPVSFFEIIWKPLEK